MKVGGGLGGGEIFWRESGVWVLSEIILPRAAESELAHHFLDSDQL